MTRKIQLPLLAILLLAGCFGDFTDAATRLAADIESGARRVGPDNGDRILVEHHTPSKAGECTGSYKIQVDKVGAIIIWCKDANGINVESSHSTSSHSRSVETLRTWIIDKAPGETLLITLERRGRAIVIVDVR